MSWSWIGQRVGQKVGKGLLSRDWGWFVLYRGGPHGLFILSERAELNMLNSLL